MLFGLQIYVSSGINNIIAKADSNIPLSAVNEVTRLIESVDKIKEIVKKKGVVAKHCFREANRVADKLAAMSRKYKQHIVYTDFASLPRQVRGLLQLDIWEMTSFRIRQLKAAEIQFKPP